MHVIVDLSLIPMGVGVSLSPYIAECEKLLQQAGLKSELHPHGTNVEGEWDDVFAAIKQCHEKVHGMGAPRISTSLRIATRVDKEQSMEDRVRSVREKLSI